MGRERPTGQDWDWIHIGRPFRACHRQSGAFVYRRVMGTICLADASGGGGAPPSVSGGGGALAVIWHACFFQSSKGTPAVAV